MDRWRDHKSSNYDKVEALLLCWNDECSDLPNTKEEVERLQSVFERDFQYNTKIEYLDSNVAAKPQVKLNRLVADFVDDHDGPNTLLIVYYGGHGKPGQIPGQLQLLGYVDGYPLALSFMMD